MKNIEIYRFISSITDKYDLGKYRFIDCGTEGRAYKVDSEVVKIFNSIDDNKKLDYRKVITTDDFSLKSFILPKRLLVVNGSLVGYVTDYFEGDLVTKSDNGIACELDLDNLKRAREVMLSDLEVLTNADIYAADLVYNLLYNNKELKTIDTIHYKKSSLACENYENLDVGIRKYLMDFGYKYQTPDKGYIEYLKRRYGPKIYSK